MFAHVTDFDAFRLAVSHKDEIKFNVQPNGLTVGCYMVSMPTTFDSPEARECRGIVFNVDGKVASRPLHKFHNVGEKEHTRIENIVWNEATRIMTKRDGSMIHTVRTGADEFVLKSKKSFTSDVAIAATNLMVDSLPNYIDFCTSVINQNCTAIFEYTSPRARIVLYYPEDELVLLHVRHNETGKYISAAELQCWASRFQVKVVTEDEALLTQLRADPLKLMEETESVEGWVIQFANGDMVKLKTKWYLERHRAMTFLRERDIAKLVLSEGIDDLKSLLAAEGADLTEIEAIETQVVTELNEVERAVAETVAKVQGMTVKDIAIMLQAEKHLFFGLVMNAVRGKPTDIKAWFTANRVDNYPLKQLNIMQTIGEPE